MPFHFLRPAHQLKMHCVHAYTVCKTIFNWFLLGTLESLYKSNIHFTHFVNITQSHIEISFLLRLVIHPYSKTTKTNKLGIAN